MPKSWQRWVTILSSSSKLWSSSRNSMRSRADIFPDLCWRSRRSAPPPSSASESRRFSSISFFSSDMGKSSDEDYKQRREEIAGSDVDKLLPCDLHGLVNAHGFREAGARRAGV